MDPKEKKREKYLAVNTVADILSCRVRTIYEMIRDGKLQAIRLGSKHYRISEKSLQDFIESSRVDPEEFFAEFDDPGNQSRRTLRSTWMDK